MGVGAGVYMCDVVKKSSRSLSHLLMSSCYVGGRVLPGAAQIELRTCGTLRASRSTARGAQVIKQLDYTGRLILEVVYRTGRNHSSWKIVPDIHNALTESVVHRPSCQI